MEILTALVAALVFGTVTLPLAIVSGNSQTYCEKVLQGTYTPGKADVCPDGNWAHVVGAIKDKLPAPKG